MLCYNCVIRTGGLILKPTYFTETRMKDLRESFQEGLDESGMLLSETLAVAAKLYLELTPGDVASSGEYLARQIEKTGILDDGEGDRRHTILHAMLYLAFGKLDEVSTVVEDKTIVENITKPKRIEE
jgi:hypothetical protein